MWHAAKSLVGSGWYWNPILSDAYMLPCMFKTYLSPDTQVTLGPNKNKPAKGRNNNLLHAQPSDQERSLTYSF